MKTAKTDWATRAARLVIPALVGILLAVGAPAVPSGGAWAQTNDRSVAPEMPTMGNVPGDSLGNTSDSENSNSLSTATTL